MTSPTVSTSPSFSWRPLVVPLALGGALLWAFWPTLAELTHRWSQDPQYSHGWLVPLFAVALLWMRGEQRAAIQPGFSWWGVVLLGFGAILRFAGDYLYSDWLDAAALLPCLAGLAVLCGGKSALKWAWPAIAFLAFMIPLPFRVEVALSHPLQKVATIASTYSLQTLGLPAVSEGNRILLNETPLNIEQACSGLSMLMIFFALATALAVVIDRPLWQKLVLVASAVPIALLANITRITVTGIMHETVGHQAADLVFHDLAGWLMMPYALVLLWLELKVLARLFVEVTPTAPVTVVPLGANGTAGPAKGKNRRRQKSLTISPLTLPHLPKRS